MRIGVVGIKGGWSTEKLADVLEELTGFRLIIEMSGVRLDLPSCRVMYEDQELNGLDAIIVKKIGGTYSKDMLDRLEVLRLLNECGLKIYSKPLSIMRVIDRLACTVTLRSGGIPMPPTTITENVGYAMAALASYGTAILKPLYSTKARGMIKLDDSANAHETIKLFKQENKVMYIQKALDLPGRDLGVVFLGGKYLTTYGRKVNGSNWTSSTAFGGSYELYEPGKEIIDLAEKAQSLFDLDFTCIDVVETPDGPMIFEVSAFGGFKGIYETSGIDAAKLYVKYVINNLKD